MQSAHSTPSTPVSNGKKPLPGGWKPIVAVALILAAVAGLALIDRWRDRPAAPVPSHEPAQALITSPAPPAEPQAPSQPVPVAPPPPPVVVNNEKLAPPPTSPPPARAPGASNPDEAGATGASRSYTVQAGVFSSPANARALQKQLKHAGIPSHLETRVQLGPFKDRQEAERVVARAKKLGVDAVLVAPRPANANQ